MKQLRQIIIFIFVGVLNTVLDFAIYFLLTRIFNIYFIAANIISVIIATSFGFFMHKLVTFADKEKKFAHQYLKFWTVSLGSLLINTGSIFLLVRFAGFNDLLAKVLGTILVMFWSYLMQKFWVFKLKAIVL